MTSQEHIRDGLPTILPKLRAFAISLAHNLHQADDLVQETILRAWNSADRFEVGSNLEAWMFTILRNQFYTQGRRRRWEVEDIDGGYAERLTTLPTQLERLNYEDMRLALTRLPMPQREALLLVVASGFSYDETAAIMGIAVGTVKSRVNRARQCLAQMLSMDGFDDVGTDSVTLAAARAA